MPCLIIPQLYQKKETKKLTKKSTKSGEAQSDERLTMVFSKFRLEDRYDIARNQMLPEPTEFDNE